jgi:uncharacterized protein (DUF302 family)
MTTRTSRFPFSETVSRLSQAMIDAGNTLFATIDQSEAAVRAGLTLRPTVLIIFGNPKGGTPVMDAFPTFALELPLKVLVWDEDGNVSVAFVAMSEVAARYGIVGMEKQIGAMDRALELLTTSVT